jgi:hypothetical protein
VSLFVGCFSFESHVLIRGGVVYPAEKYTGFTAVCGYVFTYLLNCNRKIRDRGGGGEAVVFEQWFADLM